MVERWLWEEQRLQHLLEGLILEDVKSHHAQSLSQGRGDSQAVGPEYPVFCIQSGGRGCHHRILESICEVQEDFTLLLAAYSHYSSVTN